MKFIRPAMEIEVMPLRNEDGVVYAYACDFGEKDTPILTGEQLSQQGFRMLNGHEPGKPLKRRKRTNYRSSEEAPTLTGNGVILHESPRVTDEELYDRLLRGQHPTEEQQEELRVLAAKLGKVEPAQEYDHQ